MKKIRATIGLAVLILSVSSLSAQYSNQAIHQYIEKYKELSINNMYEYKIPASITMAQGIFESAAGTSRLAVEGNNHFGIKCHSDWSGDTLLLDDDALQECFRKYAKAEESYKDHSLFLKNRKRYSALFELNIMDYPGWARGLKAAGYATNPEYANRLITLIQKYDLAKLDTLYQERLAAGYFQNYPDVHPDLLAQTETTKPAAQTGRQPVAASENQSNGHSAKNETADKTARQDSQTGKTDKTGKGIWKGNSGKQAAQPGKKTEPAVQPSVTETAEKQADSNPQVAETEVAQEASEVADTDEKPTGITVFSAHDGDFPLVQYPFTDRKVYENNKTYFVIAQKGDNYGKIARAVQSTEKKLKKYNDASGASKLKIGQVVYIERKAKSAHPETYKVVNAETLLYISQKTGVRLDCIYKYNGLKSSSKIRKGDIIKLKK